MNLRSGFAASTLLLSSCASMNDQERTSAQATGLGALGGAALGAGIAHATGNDAAMGAVLGLMLGAVGGSVYGQHVANLKAQYARQEDFLDVVIAEARTNRQTWEANNAQLLQDVDRIELALNTNQDAMKANQAEWANQRVQMQNWLNSLNGANQEIDKEIAVYKEAIAQTRGQPEGNRLQTLQQEVAALEQQKRLLDGSTRRVAALNNRMSL